MSDGIPEPRISQAVDALRAFDRRKAASLIGAELAAAPEPGERWRGIAELAAGIGEIELSLEASRRLAMTTPQTLERILDYCDQLSKYGRAPKAMRQVEKLPPPIQNHPAVLHYRGVVEMQMGNFAVAEELFRKAIDIAPTALQIWYVLAILKKFHPGDPDIVRMETMRGELREAPPEAAGRFLYGLGKAYDDIGDTRMAYGAFREGASIMRSFKPPQPSDFGDIADQLVRDFVPRNMARLQPSGNRSERVIFVTGLPRSGTTLVEQILIARSEVDDGAEVGLVQPALIPTGNYAFSGALAYQDRLAGSSTDPWGDLADDYLGMIAQRFPGSGRIVDKTMDQSQYMGLLLHMLPSAKVLWLRRDPEDAAFSCFHNFFTAQMPWTWSPASIAKHFRTEDILYRHWSEQFPDRILTVPYEDLARDPEPWIAKILAHAGLSEVDRTLQPHKTPRPVMTGSAVQVRSAISTKGIGRVLAYPEFREKFQEAYFHAR